MDQLFLPESVRHGRQDVRAWQLSFVTIRHVANLHDAPGQFVAAVDQSQARAGLRRRLELFAERQILERIVNSQPGGAQSADVLKSGLSLRFPTDDYVNGRGSVARRSQP